MKLLAVDTALGACSAAVLDDGTVLAHQLEFMDRGHAERVAPMVRDVMHEARVEFGMLDRLAVTTGPGTFTGQRVGIAFMRGLRVALKCPLIGVTTLECMLAEAMAKAGLSVAAVLHDAKRGEVYCAAIANGALVVPVSVLAFESALDNIRQAVGDVPFAVAGTAGERAAEMWRMRGATAEFVGPLQPDALWVARLAAAAEDAGSVPRPLYLRAPDAKLPAPAQR